MAAAQRLFKNYAFHVFDRMQRDYWTRYREKYPHKKKYGAYKIKYKTLAKKDCYEFEFRFDGPRIIIDCIYEYDGDKYIDCNYVITLKNENDKYSYDSGALYLDKDGNYRDSHGNITKLEPGFVYMDENFKYHGDYVPAFPPRLESVIDTTRLVNVHSTGYFASQVNAFAEWLRNIDILEMDMGSYGHFYLHVYEKIVLEQYERACLCSKIARRVPGEYIVEPISGPEMKEYLT